VPPLSRTRRISLITAEGLTANRAAACRAELPSVTARTSRSRKSPDKGAVITASPSNNALEPKPLIPCNPKML
jgi:hypothetical protein